MSTAESDEYNEEYEQSHQKILIMQVKEAQAVVSKCKKLKEQANVALKNIRDTAHKYYLLKREYEYKSLYNYIDNLKTITNGKHQLPLCNIMEIKHLAEVIIEMHAIGDDIDITLELALKLTRLVQKYSRPYIDEALKNFNDADKQLANALSNLNRLAKELATL